MTLTSLVFVLLWLLSSSSVRMGAELTQVAKAKALVVGGVEVVPHSLPYQAALIINDQYFCGGVMISSQYVLTVAHCVDDSSSVEVILGAHNIYSEEDTQQVFDNSIVIVHENYTESTGQNDIALVKLNKHATLTTAIKPVRYLADEGFGDFNGSTGLLSGWGYVSYSSGHLEENLRQVYLNIIGNQECSTYVSLQGVNLFESQVCTSGVDAITGAVGACYGDSGGPLVVDDVLVGLVSYGYKLLCEVGYPTVYTRISYYRSWIAKYSGV